MSPGIRFATENDAEAIRDIYAPIVRETAISFQETPPSAAEFREKIADGRYPWLVCEDEGESKADDGESRSDDDSDGEIVGFAKAGPHKDRGAYRWAVDVSAYVRDDWHEQGVGTGLYDALLPILTEQGFYTAVAVVALPNPASVGFHESMEFEAVGVFEEVGFKNGEWRNVGWWQRSLDVRPADPDPPQSVEAVEDSERVTAALERGGSAVGD